MSTDKNKSEQHHNEQSPEDLNRENINPTKPAELDKASPGDPKNEKDPHRGITDTPSQHEQLLPEDEDDNDSSLDEELDDLDIIDEEEVESDDEEEVEDDEEDKD